LSRDQENLISHNTVLKLSKASFRASLAIVPLLVVVEFYSLYSLRRYGMASNVEMTSPKVGRSSGFLLVQDSMSDRRAGGHQSGIRGR